MSDLQQQSYFTNIYALKRLITKGIFIPGFSYRLIELFSEQLHSAEIAYKNKFIVEFEFDDINKLFVINTTKGEEVYNIIQNCWCNTIKNIFLDPTVKSFLYKLDQQDSEIIYYLFNKLDPDNLDAFIKNYLCIEILDITPNMRDTAINTFLINLL